MVLVELTCKAPSPERARTPNVTHFLIKVELAAETADGMALAPVPANIAQKLTGFQERGRPRPLDPHVDSKTQMNWDFVYIGRATLTVARLRVP